MENTGWFVYADQAAAEEAASRTRAELFGLIAALEELNESVDSLKLQRIIEHKKFALGL